MIKIINVFMSHELENKSKKIKKAKIIKIKTKEVLKIW